MFNHDALIGQECKEMRRNGEESGSLGTISNSYNEDGRHYIVLDDDFEFEPSKVEQVVEITKGVSYIRVYA
jgi:hypothetical protein